MLNLESRKGIFIAAYSCLALGFLGLTWTAVVERNLRSILFLVCAIICGYIYQVEVSPDIRIVLESYAEVINLQFLFLVHCHSSVHHFG